MASQDKSYIPIINQKYMTPLKTEKEKDELHSQIIQKISSKKGKINLKYAKINLTANSFNNSSTNLNKIKTNTTPIKLPILDSNNNSSYSKRKQYKVFLPKHIEKKELSFEEQEKKVINLLDKYAKSDNIKNKYLFDDNISRKYDFDNYLKLQAVADIKFKPRIGDSSNLLINYIKKVSKIRKKVVGDVLDDIKKKTENRYNLEKPNVDFKFRSKDKNLVDNMWKNAFSLDEYQKYFIRHLKGKISDMSYLSMVKKFKKISLICFSEGNLNRAAIKKLDNVN